MERANNSYDKVRDRPSTRSIHKGNRKHQRKSSTSMANDTKATFVSDSLLRPIAAIPGLNAEAWRHRWNMYLMRGGTVKNMAQLFGTRRFLDPVNKIVICIGSNDLNNMLDMEEDVKTETFSTMISSLEYIIHKAAEACSLVGVIIPPPRKKVKQSDHVYLTDQLERMAANIENVILIDITMGKSWDEYIAEYLHDDVHINR